MNKELVDKFLLYLGLTIQDPTLDYLNQLVKQHQLKVRWENLSKFLYYETGVQRGSFIPPIEEYIENITEHGLGGTCWTHSAGFHWLLTQLGFEVHYVYMDSGHICLRVQLDQPYYADVGFCAPLFQAYPMFQSFVAQDQRETFRYTVTEDEIKIERTPGPTKTLSPHPVSLADLAQNLQRSNDWAISPVLKELLLWGYVDGIPTSLTNRVLKRYFPTHKEETELSEEELLIWVTEKFKIDEWVYHKAMDVLHRKRVQ